MGHIDIKNLFEIYYEVNKIKKKHNLNFHFKIDEGDYETAIEFIENKTYHPPISKDWSNHPDIFCPDLLDYENKIIIEYEEEIGNPKPGAKLAKKGHNREGDMPNKRDSRRKWFYDNANFTCFQIWESDEGWRLKLERLLITHKYVQ